MRNFKKILAATLAATMVLSSSITALADGDTSGSSTGAGTSEGHVEKKATSVTLPTIADNTTPFAYTMDPEGLVVATSHEKYGSAVEFPASNDSQVYFNNGKKGGEGTDKDNVVYANTSAAQTVTNKSSHAIDLTVSVSASQAATDIPLVEKTALSDATDASLYLGLKVGSADAIAVSTETAATKTVSIAGTPANFKVAVKSDNSGYEYRALTLAEYQALDGNSSKTQDDYDGTWANTSFNLEGAVTTDKAITSTTTAPTLTVTWSWVDPTANAAPSIAVTSYSMEADTEITISYSLGLGDLAASGISEVEWVEGAPGANLYNMTQFVTKNETAKTFTLTTTSINNMIAGEGDSQTIKVKFDDDTEIELTFSDPE